MLLLCGYLRLLEAMFVWSGEMGVEVGVDVG